MSLLSQWEFCLFYILNQHIFHISTAALLQCLIAALLLMTALLKLLNCLHHFQLKSVYSLFLLQSTIASVYSNQQTFIKSFTVHSIVALMILFLISFELHISRGWPLKKRLFWSVKFYNKLIGVFLQKLLFFTTWSIICYIRSLTMMRC